MANGCQIYDTGSQARRFYTGSVFGVAADWATPTGCARMRLPCRWGRCSKSQPTGTGAALVPYSAALDLPHALVE